MLNNATEFTHIYMCTGYTDLRKGVPGLLEIIHGCYNLDPRQEGSIFLFCGRKTDRIKTLSFEGDGWLLCYKKLTGESRFQWPRSQNEAKNLSMQQFRWLMEGLKIEQKHVIQKSVPDIY